MCESTVLLNRWRQIMEDALFIKIDGENIGLTDILGTRKNYYWDNS